MEVFTRNSFVFGPPYQSACWFAESCSGTKYYLEATFYCLRLMICCSYPVSELSSLAARSGF
jgi:hypothetical protein